MVKRKYDIEMKRLSFGRTAVRRIVGPAEREIAKLTYDSRRVERGDCFFAVAGTPSGGVRRPWFASGCPRCSRLR